MAANFLFVFSCSQIPEVTTLEIKDLSYDELKRQYNTCKGRGVMTSRGKMPWKLNYSFTTQNDSSFIQFKDIFGRRILFVQALPSKVTLWEMQKNIQYDSDISTTIPIFSIIQSYDIAQILWGEIPIRYVNNSEESGFHKDSNLVNFTSFATQLGTALKKVTFKLDEEGTIVEFKISERDFGGMDTKLLKGIPENIPLN